MCWNKKSKKPSVEETLLQARYESVKTALEDILKMDYKKEDVQEGAALETDYEFTVRMMRTRARLSLDFVGSITAQENKK